MCHVRVFFLCAPFCLEECVQDCRVCVCLWELILGVSICSLSSKRWTSHSCLLGLPASSRSPSSSPPCIDTHWLTHTSEFLSNNQCFFCFCFTLKPQVRWKLKILQLTTDCPGSLIMLTDCYFYYSGIYTLQIAQQACFNIQSPQTTTAHFEICNSHIYSVIGKHVLSRVCLCFALLQIM